MEKSGLYMKNRKSNTCNKATSPSSPVSPNLKHISDNSPTLNINISDIGVYENTSP